MSLLLKTFMEEGNALADRDIPATDALTEFRERAALAQAGVAEPLSTLSKSQLESFRKGEAAIIDRAVEKIKSFLADPEVADCIRKDRSIRTLFSED